MKRFALAAAAAFALAATSASAAVIDAFDLSQGPVTSINSVTATSTVANDGSFIGATGVSTRTISAVGDGTGAPSTRSTTVEIGGGVFEFASGVGVTGVGTLAYEDLGGFDFSQFTGFRLVDLNTDGDFFYELLMVDTDSNASGVVGGILGDVTGATLDIAFSGLIGTADLSSIESFALLMGGPGSSSALDFSITALEAVPVPAALPLLAAGVGVFALVRRRRQTA